jgi:poly-gamma-glutamate capsule biosynthesis protein CapA/YwtB (metallophosphatase superfamily)
VKLFLCGAVMTGRGIDQILAAPCDPAIEEPWVKDARDYVALAERAHGPIPRGADPQYVWGEALQALDAERPDARIVNLETAVTTSDKRACKDINYRMSPANAACVTAARIDCCVLANNHVLDWGACGLEETLDTLKGAGDIVVVSIHWGPNWGYEVEREQRDFAQLLVDAGAADLVHGHSPHHPGALEVHRGRLILYACGDFINDYEGIAGHESFRPEFTLMYLPTLDDASGALRELAMRPMRLRRFRLEHASPADAEWLAATLRRASGMDIERAPDNRLHLQ